LTFMAASLPGSGKENPRLRAKGNDPAGCPVPSMHKFAGQNAKLCIA
jgi:hypothetical protein